MLLSVVRSARCVAACTLLNALAAATWAQSPPPVLDPGAGRGLVNPPPAVSPGTVIENPASPAPARPGWRPPAKPVVAESGPKRVMAVGEVSVIGLSGVARIALGNGALVKATVVDDREIVLLAESAGSTIMHVWLRNGRQITYELQILASRADRALEDLQALLKETPGISARMVGERIVIEGRYPNAEAAKRLKMLAMHFPQVLNLVPDAPADADPLQLERMVQIDLRVVEVKKRALDQLGIKWATSANGPTFATNVLGYSNTPYRPIEGFAPVNTAHPIATYLGLATTITSALNFLEQNGDAWTLAEPRLSCRSGGESEFLAGGEIPIPVGQGFGAVSVEYKKYGVMIEFKPVADAQGNIDSRLLVEVSEPDTRNANGGFIAFTTNRTETQVALKQGEPLVIAGLLRQKSDKSMDSIPGLGKIPFMSLLFGARESRTEQTELFIIATPRVITPEFALNKLGIERAAEMSTETDQKTRERLMPPPAGTPFDPANAAPPQLGNSRGSR